MRYRFDSCLLDTDAWSLSVDGTDVPIQPQVADVLTMLIECRERVW